MVDVIIVNVVCYSVAIVGGVALFVAPFTRATRTSPHWVRVALWMSGLASMGWGALGFTLIFGRQLLPKVFYALAVHFKTGLEGVGFGILVLLFASGEFLPAFFRRRIGSK